MKPSHNSHRYVDLSHTVHDGLQTYPGLPAPVICDYLSREDSRSHYAPGTEFQIGKIEMVARFAVAERVPFIRLSRPMVVRDRDSAR